MEPGNCATGNGCKQNGKHVLYSVTIVHCESCKGREQLRIDIGMRAHNAYKRNKKHCIQQERTQIVTGLQQNPYRRHRRDGNINTHDNHPCIGGQIQRMEIHTHCHNCNDGHNTQHRGNCHGRVSAVYAEAKYNGNQDKQQRYHGNACVGTACGCIQNTGFIIFCPESGSYYGSKGSHHQ